MKKNILIFILPLLIYSCSKTSSYKGKINNNMNMIANYNLSKEELLKTYDNGSLEIYKEDRIKNIVLEIENGERDINSLEKADVLNVIGSPYLIKNEIVMELWQYRNPFCILNVIWDNSRSGVKEIVTYSNNLEKVDIKQCVLDTLKFNPDNKLTS